MPTSGMWSAVQWNGLRTTSGPPTSRPLATQRTDHDDRGDAGRAAAAEERREREREAAEAHRDEADPEREADRADERDLVAERGVAERVRADREHDREDRHREPEHRQVRGELLEGDPALAERRGGDEVEAARARPRRRACRTGRGSTRAPRRGRRSRRTSRSCSRRACRAWRPSGSALPNRLTIDAGMLPTSVVDLEAGLGRREDLPDRGAHDERAGRRADRPR